MKLPARVLSPLLSLFPLSALASDWSLHSVSAAAPAGSAPGHGLHLGFEQLRALPKGGGRGLPIAGTRFLHRFESGFDSLPGDVSITDIGLATPLLPLSYENWRLIVLGNYRATWFESSAPNLIPEDTLHHFRLPVALLHDYSDKWVLGGMAMPGYTGDFSSFGDGFSIAGALGAVHNYSPQFKVGVGIYANHGNGETIVVPGVGFIWNPTPDWTVSLTGPIATIGYWFGENTHLAAVARYESATWNVEADAIGPARDVKVSEIRAGLRVDQRLFDKLWIYLTGGVNFGRRLEIENLGDASLQESDIDPGAFVRGGFNLRF